MAQCGGAEAFQRRTCHVHDTHSLTRRRYRLRVCHVRFTLFLRPRRCDEPVACMTHCYGAEAFVSHLSGAEHSFYYEAETAETDLSLNGTFFWGRGVVAEPGSCTALCYEADV